MVEVEDSEIIVEVGGEGGSISLLGRREGKGFVFAMASKDSTADFLAVEDRVGLKPTHGLSGAVESWAAALRLLDRYPWARLYPLSIHPEFKQKIWVAARKRLKDGDEYSLAALRRWKELCGRSAAVEASYREP